MLYIVGTTVSVKKTGTPREAAFGVNKKLKPRRNTIFPTGKTWTLGRIYKDTESDKFAYDFYNANDSTDVLSLRFTTFEEADLAIAAARGEKIMADEDRTTLTEADIQKKYDRLTDRQTGSKGPNKMGQIYSPQSRNRG